MVSERPKKFELDIENVVCINSFVASKRPGITNEEHFLIIDALFAKPYAGGFAVPGNLAQSAVIVQRILKSQFKF
jgi:hypothetical protein